MNRSTTGKANLSQSSVHRLQTLTKGSCEQARFVNQAPRWMRGNFQAPADVFLL